MFRVPHTPAKNGRLNENYELLSLFSLCPFSQLFHLLPLTGLPSFFRAIFFPPLIAFSSPPFHPCILHWLRGFFIYASNFSARFGRWTKLCPLLMPDMAFFSSPFPPQSRFRANLQKSMVFGICLPFSNDS